MTGLPEYLITETEEVIKQRMLERVPSDQDTSEGSYIYDSISPAAIELALAATWAQEVLRRGFASTTFGSYLDERCKEHGLTRREAVKASGQVKFTGLPNTVVGSGTKIATPADSATGMVSVEFETLADVTLDSSGIGHVNILALEAGSSGNVAAGKISVLVDTVPGLLAVTNPSLTSGGTDTEDDVSLLSRYYQRVQSPSAGGNKSDYINWAMEVSGVGGVSVIPVKYGPGTVSIALIDSDKNPAGQSFVDAVQNCIAPPWINTVEAENMSSEGVGVEVDSTQTDDEGDSIKMIYDAAGVGSIKHVLEVTVDSEVQPLLQQPGIWQARPKMKVDDSSLAIDFLQIGVWNISANTWTKTRPNGTTDSVITLKASDLTTVFENKALEFYWNGQDQLAFQINRMQTDMTTTVWIDRVDYCSAFSKDTGEGKAPVGAKVTVEPAGKVTVDISAVLTIMAGYNADFVKSQVADNLSDYIKSLAFQVDNDLRYVRIGQVILDTDGVQDYSDLLVNGGVANIPVDVQEVAVIGSVTLI